MSETVESYGRLIRQKISANYTETFREAGGALSHPFLVPGSAHYADTLWDWDSWLSNVALRQVLSELADETASRQAVAYERGCVLNFLEGADLEGWMPIQKGRQPEVRPDDYLDRNMHKPCLAQHAAFLVKQDGGDAEWLRESFYYLQAFVNCYRNHHRHRSGLYYWQDDFAIGVDNDPCTFYRPPKSSGSIFLNCLMYRELLALVYLCERLGLDEVAAQYRTDAEELRAAIRAHCWDDWLGFYYSVDLNLRPVESGHGEWRLHHGQPRDYDTLIQRIGVWSGFLAMWAEIATPEQAQRIVAEHYTNEATFLAPFGVRTLSKKEKMYNLRASGNPSSWLGPVWGVSNYLTFRGLVKYGFLDEAKDLAEKTIRLFGRDFERFGSLHEYYQPENGEPILNRGFQNWNHLVLNMLAWLEGQPVVEEY
jgi:putative isomerase